MMFRTSGVDGGWIFPGSSSNRDPLLLPAEIGSAAAADPPGSFPPHEPVQRGGAGGTGVVLLRILEDECIVICVADVKGGREQQATGNGGNREQEI
ncbi:unnamed protein product [Musa textilis]